MNPSPFSVRTLIVMGVSGSGKSLIGEKLAQALGGVFEDADDFHPASNKAKMSARIPLTDEDRWPWLQGLRKRIEDMRAQTPCYVLACSALKHVYRDLLRGGDPQDALQFVYLSGSQELVAARLDARKGHFMPSTLLTSQFNTLEAPGEGEAVIADISGTPEEIVTSVLRQLSQTAAAS